MDDKIREMVVEERPNTVLTRAESVLGGQWYNLYAKKKEPLQANITDRSTAYKMLEKAEAFYKKQQMDGVL
jgi:hypothetical protein